MCLMFLFPSRRARSEDVYRACVLFNLKNGNFARVRDAGGELGEAKVREFQVSGIVKETVFRLDVPVHHPLLVPVSTQKVRQGRRGSAVRLGRGFRAG